MYYIKQNSQISLVNKSVKTLAFKLNQLKKLKDN